MVRNGLYKRVQNSIELLEQSNKPLRQVARELGVAENNLYNRRKDYRTNQEKSIPTLNRFELIKQCNQIHSERGSECCGEAWKTA